MEGRSAEKEKNVYLNKKILCQKNCEEIPVDIR